jgi:hypothetical protein
MLFPSSPHFSHGFWSNPRPQPRSSPGLCFISPGHHGPILTLMRHVYIYILYHYVYIIYYHSILYFLDLYHIFIFIVIFIFINLLYSILL